MHPFGTDDDDIELNYILDRHVQASFALVTEACCQRPTLHDDDSDRLCKDGRLPHTQLSAKLIENPPKLHADVCLKRPEDGQLHTADIDSQSAAQKQHEKQQQLQF